VLRLPESKTAVTIRLDRQVLDWFKAKGPGDHRRIKGVGSLFLSTQLHKQRLSLLWPFLGKIPEAARIGNR
jgi:hypothetical protein